MHLETQQALLEKKYPGIYVQFHATVWPPEEALEEVPLPVKGGPQTLGLFGGCWLLVMSPKSGRVLLYKLLYTKMTFLREFHNFVAGVTYVDRVLGHRFMHKHFSHYS